MEVPLDQVVGHCAVCKTAITHAGNYGELECSHRFHLMCFTRWSQHEAARGGPVKCPQCRRQVDDQFAEHAFPNIASIQKQMSAESADDLKKGAQSSATVPISADVTMERDSGPAPSAPPAASPSVPPLADTEKRYVVPAPVAESVFPLPEYHHLVYEDVSMDDLRRDHYELKDLEALMLTWRDVMRMGLRPDHLSEWVGVDNVARAFSATWEDLQRDFSFTLDTAIQCGFTADTMRDLGCTADSLLRDGMTRAQFIALPFSLQDWRSKLGFRRDHLQRLALRHQDYVALAPRGWHSFALESEFKFSDQEMRRVGMALDLGQVELVI